MSSMNVHVSNTQFSIPSQERTKLFFLKCDTRIFVFEETQKSPQDAVGDVYFPGRFFFRQKCLEQSDVLVSSDGIETSLDFGPHSVILTV